MEFDLSNEGLALAIKEWRGDKMSAQMAARLLGLPPRTLQGIEQGRGFRYPRTLQLAMQAIRREEM
jgi:DNA-binding XRE family transcriptional regulator